MSKIDLGLILPPTGTLIYTDGVSMNYNIPVTLGAKGKQKIFSIVSEEDTVAKEKDNNGK